MHKLTIFLFALIALSWVQAQDDVDNEFENFKSKFGKNYGTPEEAAKRKKLFADTHAKIKAHNKKNAGYEMAHNKFSDMTNEEKKVHLGADSSLSGGNREAIFYGDVEDRQVPTSLDYRNNTCLAAIKDQGDCGSCWAFTTIASLEFSKCRKTGSKILLSEQQLVDCDTANYGCDGGWWDAWNYLKNGAASSSSYTYASGTSGVAGSCKFSSTMTAAKVSSWGYVASKNPSAMQSALVTYGPLAVAINVVDSFFYYYTGVYSDSTCTGTSGSINHAVNVVGYGSLNGVNHWIVRNSWGTWWGNKGYVLIRRGANMCNIEMYPAYVVAA